MPPEIAALGPWIVLIWFVLMAIGRFGTHTVWPFFVKHVWPQWSTRAKADREREEREQREQRERDERDERERQAEHQRREDRLYELMDLNRQAAIEQARATTGLQAALDRMSGQLGQQSEVIHALALDVSGLYGHLQVPRPSRAKQRPTVAIDK